MKTKYLLESAARSFVPERQTCPNCGGAGTRVSSKYVVTALRRCNDCELLYRTPTDKPQDASDFYNNDYVEGFTTDMPSDEQLEALKQNDFQGQECDYQSYRRILDELGLPKGAALFDFGCSWGYGSYQLRTHGFDVTSTEISRPRGRYAQEKLGVRLVPDFDGFVAANEGTFDVFFSSHVLEHVPSPTAIIGSGKRLLKPGGLFVSFFPNGSEKYRAAAPTAWQSAWGKVHPNFLDDRYLARVFADMRYVIGATPLTVDAETRTYLAEGTAGGKLLNDLIGHELCVIARKL